MLQPTRGKILVEVLPEINRTESGLYLTPKEEVPHRGKVVEIGLPYRDKNGRELVWGIVKNHIIHFKRVWDQQKVTHYILKREQIFAVEHEEKAYAFGEYVVIKKDKPFLSGKIFVPQHFESEVAKQHDYGVVVSVGRENRQGVSDGDTVMFFKNEGLKVQIPQQEELWSLKPRALFAKLNPSTP